MKDLSMGPRTGTAPPSRSGISAWISTLGSAVLCLVCVLALTRLGQEYVGPQSVAVSAESVWTSTHGKLWQLSKSGQVVRVLSTDALDIGSEIDDIAALNDTEIVLHDAGPGSWCLCRLPAEGTGASTCQPIFTGGEADRNSHQAAIAVEPGGTRWVFADFDQGDILLLDAEPGILSKGEGLRGQDGGTILWLSGQTLALIASDQPTLYTCAIAENRITPLEKKWSLQKDSRAVGGYIWSAAFNPDRHVWWISYAAVRRAVHELWKVNESGDWIQSLDLDRRGQPGRLATLDRTVALLTDAAARQLRRVNDDSGKPERFGERRLLDALESDGKRGEQLHSLRLGFLVAAVLLPISIGIWFVYRDSRQPSTPARPLPAPAPIDGVFWFSTNEKSAKSIRKLLFMLGFVSFVAAFALIYTKKASGVSVDWQYYLVAVAGLAMMICCRFEVQRKMRLGLKEELVLFDRGDGRLREVPIETVLTDGRILYLGHTPLTYATRFPPPMWNTEEIYAYLLPRLPRQNWVSQNRLVIEQLWPTWPNALSRPLTDPPELEGEAWLTMNPKWLPTMRLLIWIGTPAWFSLFLIIFLSTQRRWRSFQQIEILLWPALAMIALIIAVCTFRWIRAQRQAERCRLGTRNGTVLYDPGTGHTEEHLPASILTNGWRLLIGRHQIRAVREGISPLMWDTEEIRSHILSRIPPENRLSRSRYWLEARRRNPSRLIIEAACTGLGFYLLFF